MNADIHFMHDRDGVRLVGPDGWTYDLEDADDLMDDTPPALEVTTIDIDPESVTEVPRAIEA